jgi:hypothetical protein
LRVRAAGGREGALWNPLRLKGSRLPSLVFIRPVPSRMWSFRARSLLDLVVDHQSGSVAVS